MQFDKKSSDGLVQPPKIIRRCLPNASFYRPSPRNHPKKNTPDTGPKSFFRMEPVNLEMVLKPVVDKTDKVPTSTTVGFLNQQKLPGFLQKIKNPPIWRRNFSGPFQGSLGIRP